ncbi:GIY-YIG nuclease family protein [Streptomyces sp. LHD-70]|uniref:GIY-YIG nuclease family protein n=1 Tax=Streptomyces sp. LHD-70 TaxID=3072140 RepID=UPI00280C5E43|nr:GIY-YIG nuclease family protein [Streptomyces sp. LHD-70]MDQ8706829.1 GIY-YIG nuclease family protein [Streptomyces sp. LHD-70]
MRSSTALNDLRDQWIQKVCAGIATTAHRDPLLDANRIAGNPNDLDLLRSLLILQIATLDARGQSATHITELLADHPVFADPKPDSDQLTSLVKRVRWRMEHGGLTSTVMLFGVGLRTEAPEGTYRLLLEEWSRQLSRNASPSQVAKELRRHWSIETLGFPDNLIPGPLKPLETCTEAIWTRLEAEPDIRVRNVVALAMIKSGNPAQELWLKQFSAHEAGHLWKLGAALVSCTAALAYLQEERRSPKLSRDAQQLFARALEGVDRHLKALTEAVACLSATERDLLRDRTQRERFQDACILTFLNHSLEARTRYSDGSCLFDAEALHGTYGPLPWWNIVVRSEEEAESVRATLDEGVLPLGFERDPENASQLLLICRKPRTESLGMRATFTFDLDNPAHACELLLIAKRSGIPVDFYAHSVNKYDEIESANLGTLYVPIGPELASLIAEVATEALTRSLPGARDCDHDQYKGVESLSAALRHLPRARVEHFSSGRQILASSQRDLEGGISPLSTDPPVALSGFFKGAKGRQKPGKSQQARTGASPLRTTGFVYVQRNPAFPSMLKIGSTDQLSEDRARGLSRTSVPFPFEVLFRANTARPEEVERAVHRLLTAQRVTSNREFFYVSLEVAVEAIRRCQAEVTGIRSWAPAPVIHHLRAGDRVVLPLKAGQLFALTAYTQLASPSAEILDSWQADGDNDLLEIHATHDPGHVAGISDNDPGASEDPVPFLNRDGSAPNGMLHGRERLVAGDRLVWLSDAEGPADARGVVFESSSFCQVTYRTSAPRPGPQGVPPMLNDLARDTPDAMGAVVRDVLSLARPRSWAPRNPQEGDDSWLRAATDPQPPEFWLRQLQRPRKNNHRRQS